MADIIGYKELTPSHIELMNEIKTKGNELGELLDTLSSTPEVNKRALAIARTEIQTGIMWAVRSVTNPTTFS